MDFSYEIAVNLIVKTRSLNFVFFQKKLDPNALQPFFFKGGGQYCGTTTVFNFFKNRGPVARAVIGIDRFGTR